jgi:hypothetical protein
MQDLVYDSQIELVQQRLDAVVVKLITIRKAALPLREEMVMARF